MKCIHRRTQAVAMAGLRERSAVNTLQAQAPNAVHADANTNVFVMAWAGCGVLIKARCEAHHGALAMTTALGLALIVHRDMQHKATRTNKQIQLRAMSTHTPDPKSGEDRDRLKAAAAKENTKMKKQNSKKIRKTKNTYNPVCAHPV